MEPNEKPLFFISHKHDDREVAGKVANFVRDVTGGRVDVFLSSSNHFEGPRVGKTLNQELKNALEKAGVVILVYTTAEKDWSWCMWECGLADDPRSPETKVVVFQCLEAQPVIFQGNVRVLAWDVGSMVSLANRFLDPEFYPGAGRPLTSFTARELDGKANALHGELDEPIKRLSAETWSAWPFLRIELERSAFSKIMANGADERPAAVRKLLLDSGKIVASSSGSPQLFGKADVEPNTTVGDLVGAWQESQPGRTTEWLDVIVRQILDGAKRNIPQVKKWPRFREVNADGEFVPGLGRVKSHPTAFQFDCYFYSFARVPLVTSAMTRLGVMYYHDLDTEAADELLLRDLLAGLERRGWNRIPILEGGKLRYIIHTSMVDRFIRNAVQANKDIASLTLADLLEAKPLGDMFSNTFAVVPESATVSEADEAMRAIHRCEDVFVTPNGRREEQVSGWLTDWDIDRALSS